MDERTALILENLIAEHIQLARPISSGYLGQRLNLALSPATIRAILHDLEEAGYIDQPHTSAGRIPTDKGYRYYVNNVEPEQLKAKQHSQLRQGLVAEQQKGKDTASSAPKVLSHFSHMLSITGSPERGEMYDAGLAEVLEESDTLEMVREISRLREALQAEMEKLVSKLDDQTVVFIGAENPVIDAEHTSLLIRRVTLPNQEDVILMMIGPKRMAYQRNISLVDSMARLLNELSL